MIRAASVDADTVRWALEDEGGRPLSFRGVIDGWRGSRAFRDAWCAGLRKTAAIACSWECPPVSEATASRPFECVFVASPALVRMTQDPGAFAEHFRVDRRVVSFDNLGSDAKLVAPCPGGPEGDYAHLARFVATAPAEQQDSLWQAVGEAMDARLGERPVWLSTAGLGIGWLHVRLDDRPKYYRHAPYARA